MNNAKRFLLQSGFYSGGLTPTTIELHSWEYQLPSFLLFKETGLGRLQLPAP